MMHLCVRKERLLLLFRHIGRNKAHLFENTPQYLFCYYLEVVKNMFCSYLGYVPLLVSMWFSLKSTYLQLICCRSQKKGRTRLCDPKRLGFVLLIVSRCNFSILLTVQHSKSSQWCQEHFLNYKGLVRASLVREQLKKLLVRFKVPKKSSEGEHCF